MRRDCAFCANFRSVMSRAIFDAPMILPSMSFTGDMVTETWINSPSLRCRTVSKGATRSPRRRLAMMRASSSYRSGRIKNVMGLPMASSAV
jgi:hypothetical protein